LLVVSCFLLFILEPKHTQQSVSHLFLDWILGGFTLAWWALSSANHPPALWWCSTLQQNVACGVVAPPHEGECNTNARTSWYKFYVSRLLRAVSRSTNNIQYTVLKFFELYWTTTSNSLWCVIIILQGWTRLMTFKQTKLQEWINTCSVS
jgi:hypothetical protein